MSIIMTKMKISMSTTVITTIITITTRRAKPRNTVSATLFTRT